MAVEELLLACWAVDDKAEGGCCRKAAKNVERKKGRCEGIVPELTEVDGAYGTSVMSDLKRDLGRLKQRL